MRNKERYNKYQRDYQRQRWKLRRATAIELLGGHYVSCGTTDDLQFDHIDPNTKIRTIAKMATASEAKLQEELGKCQLLCKQCHIDKTNKNKENRRGYNSGRSE